MKFILSESRFNDIVIKYLNNYEWRTEVDYNRNMSVYDEPSYGKRLFYVRNDTYQNINKPPKFRLIIDKNFYKSLGTFFGENNITPLFIVNWFNERFNIDCVDYVFFDIEMADRTEEEEEDDF